MNRVRRTNMTLREKATAVFRLNDDGTYTAEKSREGDVIIGGKYDYGFVKAYAARSLNVYIEGGQ